MSAVMVFLPACRQLNAQAPSFNFLHIYSVRCTTIFIIGNWFKLYNKRWKHTLIRQMGKFAQGLTHVTTVIVHKGGVAGEP